MSLCQTKQGVPPAPRWSNAHNIVTYFKDKLAYCNVNSVDLVESFTINYQNQFNVRLSMPVNEITYRNFT